MAIRRIRTMLSAALAVAFSFVLVFTASAVAGTAAKHRAPAADTRKTLVELYTRDRDYGSVWQRAKVTRLHGRSLRAHAAVVGGTQVTVGEYPWQVAMFAEFEAEGETYYELCGGAVIGMSRVVTAGHCAVDPFTGAPFSPGSVFLLAGVSSISVAEIEHGATVEVRGVERVRVHPDFNYNAGPGTPDDVAVFNLSNPLVRSSGVAEIGLPTSATSPAEGTSLDLSGFGAEGEEPEVFDEALHSLSVVLGSSRQCGGEAGAVFLCGTGSNGTACSGDSGGGLVDSASGSPTLVGLVDTVAVVGGQHCRGGALDGFVNVTAPEIRDFIEGDEGPPIAPRGSGVVIRGVPTAGQALTCEAGSWSGSPSYRYAFIDSADSQVLQQGGSATYTLSEADVGRTILCEVQATNAGGTGSDRTQALVAVKAAPASSSGGTTTTGTTTTTPTTTTTTTTGGGSNSGVLTFVTATVSATELKALLSQEITPSGKAAKIAAFSKAGGYKLRFSAPEAGVAVVGWYELPKGAKLTRTTPKPVEVASGHASFSSAGVETIDVKLTSAGRRLLKGVKRLKLTARGVFTPSGGAAVSLEKAFVLTR